jgi:hypothetical protein
MTKRTRTKTGWYTSHDLAERWSIDRQTVIKFATEGIDDLAGRRVHLVGYKMGAQWRFKPEDVTRFEKDLSHHHPSEDADSPTRAAS